MSDRTEDTGEYTAMVRGLLDLPPDTGEAQLLAALTRHNQDLPRLYLARLKRLRDASTLGRSARQIHSAAD